MPNCDLNTSEMADQSARKRTYRQRVTCSECGKEIDSDYADSHGKKHQGKRLNLSPYWTNHKNS